MLTTTHLCIWIREKRLDRNEYLGDGGGDRPVVLNRIDADISMAGDVRVKDAGYEAHQRRTQRITV